MNSSPRQEDLRFRALAEAAIAAVSGKSVELVAQKALVSAAEYIGLTAGALILWDEQGEIKVKSITAGSDNDRQILLETESSLLSMLRQDFKLNAAYMELGGEPVRSVFSLPIETGGRQFGALVGIKLDKAQLHDYDHFLRALAAVLALTSSPVIAGGEISPQEVESKVKSERETAIVEMAVAINHEINNPLTALLGNLQLLMLKNRNLPEDIQSRLKIIEESANQIREVTGRLMKAAEAPTVDYTGTMKMIDLSGKSEKGREDLEEDEEEKGDET
jgi:signal transduction histidine kinase